jgi:exodeoxyribonuclease VII small subunit
MARSQPKSNTSKTTSFSQQLEELERIIEQFESEDIELEASLSAYERGLQLLDSLKQQLDNTESKVEIIKKKFER